MDELTGLLNQSKFWTNLTKKYLIKTTHIFIPYICLKSIIKYISFIIKARQRNIAISSRSAAATSRGRGEVSRALFWKYKKSVRILQKNALILKKSALIVFIYCLNSHLKCSFKNSLEKKHQNVSLRGASLHAVHETFIEVSLFQEIFTWQFSFMWLTLCSFHLMSYLFL